MTEESSDKNAKSSEYAICTDARGRDDLREGVVYEIGPNLRNKLGYDGLREGYAGQIRIVKTGRRALGDRFTRVDRDTSKYSAGDLVEVIAGDEEGRALTNKMEPLDSIEVGETYTVASIVGGCLFVDSFGGILHPGLCRKVSEDDQGIVFEPGDRVRLIEEHNGFKPHDEVYEVKEVFDSGVGLHGSNWRFPPEKLELVEEAQCGLSGSDEHKILREAYLTKWDWSHRREAWISVVRRCREDSTDVRIIIKPDGVNWQGLIEVGRDTPEEGRPLTESRFGVSKLDTWDEAEALYRVAEVMKERSDAIVACLNAMNYDDGR